MKKKALVILASILLISSFSACGDEVSGKDDNHSFINYTDTGENSSSINSKTADIEHNFTDSDLVVTSNENTDKKTGSNKKKVSESNKSGSPNKSTSITASSTVDTDTITYYYDNDDGDTDSSASQTSNRENDSDSSSNSDDNSDTVSDTESNLGQPSIDEPDVVGSYTEEDIVLYFNGAKVHLGDSLDSVLEIVGEPGFIDNNNLTYNYKDFNITFTRSEDSSEAFVESIQIIDSGVETEKGITIGTSLEDVVRAYGESTDFIEKSSEYRYYVGNKYMCFYAPNGLVGGIDYGIDPSVDN